MRFWNLKASGEGDKKTLDIEVFGVIEPGFWDDGGTKSAEIAAQLKEHRDAKAVTVHINSMGGDPFGGAAIYNLLRQHPAAASGNLLTIVEGLAASAASIVAMAGRTRMLRGAMMMVHNPWTVAIGDANELRATADTLDTIRDSLLVIYEAKTGQTRDQIKALLDKETWFTAEEAKRQGFADEIENAPVKAKASAGKVILNTIEFPRARVPDQILALAETIPEQSRPTVAAERIEMILNQELMAGLGLPEEADELHVEARVQALADFERDMLATLGVSSVEEARAKATAGSDALQRLPALEADKMRAEGEARRRDLRASLEAGLSARKLNLATIQRTLPFFVSDPAKKDEMRSACASIGKLSRGAVLDAVCGVELSASDVERIKEFVREAPLTSPDPLREPSRQNAELQNDENRHKARAKALDAEFDADPGVKPSVAIMRAAKKDPKLFNDITQNEGV